MLVCACFPPDAPPPTILEARRHPHAARWLDASSGPPDITVIAELEDGTPIGAGVGRFFETPEPPGPSVPPGTPELALAVAPEHRGRGLGTFLLRAWLEALEARGIRSAFLTVSVRNLSAIRLYEGAGFRKLGQNGNQCLMLFEHA